MGLKLGFELAFVIDIIGLVEEVRIDEDLFMISFIVFVCSLN